MGLFRRRKDKEESIDEDEPPRRRVTKVRRSVLGLVYEAAKGSHPREFGATLRAEGDTVTEVILVPGMLGGDRHAILPLNALPIDLTIVGTVHSHPTPNATPSDADLQLFRHFGHTHIICGYPYNDRTWRAYDQAGRAIELAVVDG